MNNCAICSKKVILKIIISVLNITTTEIALALNVSRSVVSRHLNGKKDCPDVDRFIIERAFGIKIKDYNGIG